jgi:hypothetical protein
MAGEGVVRRGSAPLRVVFVAAAVAGAFGSTGAWAQQAVSSVSPLTVDLGSTKVGGTFGTQAITVANTATAPAEDLMVLFTHSAGITLAGGTFIGAPVSGRLIGPVAPNSSDSSLIIGLDSSTTGTAGPVSRIAVAESRSIGAGSPSTSLSSQQLTVTGKVYRSAQPSTISTPVNLGITHVNGSFGTRALTISNLAANDGYSESLIGGYLPPNPMDPMFPNGSLSGHATASGSLGLVAPGASSTGIVVGLSAASTASAGLKTGQVGLNFASNGQGTSGLGTSALPLGTESQFVGVEGQVNDYASAVLNKASGDGTFAGAGPLYTLNFGTILQGSASPSAQLGVQNNGGSAAFTDVLNGNFTYSGGAAFLLTGFGTFSGIAGGSGIVPGAIAMSTTNVGSFSETLVLHWNGSNAGGYSGPYSDITLQLSGNVAPVPEPHEWAMMLAGLGMVGVIARRRRANSEASLAT